MDARHRDVLIAIIREYVDSAEPVGSRVLAKRHFPSPSPATIRHGMARAVTLAPPLPADEARAIGRELSRRFGGRTVEQIVDMESAPSDPLDALHTRARAVTDQIVALLNGRTLYVSGAINMLDHPEFWDLETTRDLLRTFATRERLAALMTVHAEG